VVLPLVVTLASLCGLAVAVRRGLGADDKLGPADLITLTRAALTCVVSGLAVAQLGTPPRPDLLTGVAATSLALDFVDGLVARRTGSASSFGARFDGEADAFLIGVLAGYAAAWWGLWVLAIGAARYLFVVAGWFWPWLTEQLPPRYWRKVAAAVAGIALVIAASGVLGGAGTSVVLLVATALIAESFGRDVLWLRRRAAIRRVSVSA
jgi:phosphatidylglycerophosphate synthase